MPPRHENRRARIGNPRIGTGQNQLAREIVAALVESNLLNPTLRVNKNDRAMETIREFCRMKPPQFDEESSDPLLADHWLSQIRKIFNALKITEDDLLVSIVACQLIGEVNEWWESIFRSKKKRKEDG
ncbi:hypothetical protein RHMOL_Rhmol08G0180900 [Rhododendron molle]|uniref:Uncharacterized protein n=1 Tax=Rhododendron molle TaxID=49168 RepID=A0ACC0MPH3_RHOML|nr:hypothetical protein RHMOL_Rhmol08G0180900 [Rhododendron molle]